MGQGAFIGIAMVLIQHNEKLEPEVKNVRETFRHTIKSKTDTMAKLGAILGYGIIDAGGRNVTMSMVSPAGHKKMAAIVGMALFPQFWYWFPNVHFISLAFTPTAVIGLNKDLLIPAPFKFVSKSPPSLWAYPKPIDLKKKEEKKTLKKATLSVTKKANARAKKKVDPKNETMKDDDDEPKDMDVDKDEKEKSETKQKDSEVKSEAKQKEEKKKKKKKKKKKS